MQANPFIHDVNQQDARPMQGGETGHTRSQRPYAGMRNTCSKDGGARRDRTDDLKLAKLPLSQLSYGPVSTQHLQAQAHMAQPQSWWAWEDLNFRPHAYQARALTN